MSISTGAVGGGRSQAYLAPPRLEIHPDPNAESITILTEDGAAAKSTKVTLSGSLSTSRRSIGTGHFLEIPSSVGATSAAITTEVAGRVLTDSSGGPLPGFVPESVSPLPNPFPHAVAANTVTECSAATTSRTSRSSIAISSAPSPSIAPSPGYSADSTSRAHSSACSWAGSASSLSTAREPSTAREGDEGHGDARYDDNSSRIKNVTLTPLTASTALSMTIGLPAALNSSLSATVSASMRQLRLPIPPGDDDQTSTRGSTNGSARRESTDGEPEWLRTAYAALQTGEKASSAPFDVPSEVVDDAVDAAKRQLAKKRWGPDGVPVGGSNRLRSPATPLARAAVEAALSSTEQIRRAPQLDGQQPPVSARTVVETTAMEAARRVYSDAITGPNGQQSTMAPQQLPSYFRGLVRAQTQTHLSEVERAALPGGSVPPTVVVVDDAGGDAGSRPTSPSKGRSVGGGSAGDGVQRIERSQTGAAAAAKSSIRRVTSVSEPSDVPTTLAHQVASPDGRMTTVPEHERVDFNPNAAGAGGGGKGARGAREEGGSGGGDAVAPPPPNNRDDSCCSKCC